MIRNKFVCFICGWSIHPKKKWWKFCIMRYAQWCSFPSFYFPDGYFHTQTKKIDSFLNTFHCYSMILMLCNMICCYQIFICWVYVLLYIYIALDLDTFSRDTVIKIILGFFKILNNIFKICYIINESLTEIWICYPYKRVSLKCFTI
jgi:hypothetical protein